MEYLPETTHTGKSYILCCECGTQIEPNSANMCVACLRTRVDITEGIPKSGSLYFCKQCERYLQPPTHWISAALESRELLSLCLKRLKGLNKVRLVDASFVWTEPHSKRIKVKITIQKEVLNGTILQQVFVVEFVVHSQMCEDCHRVEAKDYWKSCVQVRQKTGHKKTLYYLEQLIIKHRAHVNTTSIKALAEGLDFFYADKRDARKLVDFLQTVVPCRYVTAQELISHDIHNNTYNYKDTFSVEIVPVCKDNIICLPPKLAQSLGNLSQICICLRVTQTVHIIDPATLQVAEVSGPVFWRSPFGTLCQPRQLTEFIIMELEIVQDKDKRHIVGGAAQSQKHVLAEVWVVKASELGTSDHQFHCRTHLGHLLSIGDTVLGFELGTANINDTHLEKMSADRIPDVVLVKKLYSDPVKRHRRRKWKLHHLDIGANIETASQTRDYNDFLEDLEEDPIFRQNVNIYKDAQKLAVDRDDMSDDGDAPQISLQEMLDDMHIGGDATGEDGADMLE